jgi:hypothetical protein
VTTHYRVRIALASTPDLVHRLRNLGEDLSRSLGSLGEIDMNEVDSATEFFSIRVKSARHLGEVTELVRKELARSGSDGAFAMERT